jgi:hypothetical protein
VNPSEGEKPGSIKKQDQTGPVVKAAAALVTINKYFAPLRAMETTAGASGEEMESKSPVSSRKLQPKGRRDRLQVS